MALQLAVVSAVAPDAAGKRILAYDQETRQFPWLHRVLMFRTKDSQGVNGQPTLSVKIEDMSEYAYFTVLGRAAPFPTDCWPLYAFDTLSTEDFELLCVRAREIAEVRGSDLPITVAGVAGYIRCSLSDPSLPHFGEEVLAATISTPDRLTSRVKILSGLAIEHGLWVETLRLLMYHDLVNPLHLACAGLAACRILMLEKRSSGVRGAGRDRRRLSLKLRCNRRSIAVHIADIQKTDAVIMMQNRLLAEEVETQTKRQKPPGGGEENTEKNGESSKEEE